MLIPAYQAFEATAEYNALPVLILLF